MEQKHINPSTLLADLARSCLPALNSIHYTEVNSPVVRTRIYSIAKSSKCFQDIFFELHQLSNRPLYFFQNREKDFWLLGLQAVPISLNDQKAVQAIVENHPQLYVIGGMHFTAPSLKSRQADEWKGFDNYNWIIPRFSFIYESQQLFLHINFLDGENIRPLINECIFHLHSLEKSTHSSPHIPTSRGIEQQVDYLPNALAWKQMLERPLQLLHTGVLQKVVLARKIITHFSKPASLEHELIRLKTMPNDPAYKLARAESFQILFAPDKNHAFLSLTPERLFKWREQELAIDCIAGTRKRGDDANQDKILEEELINCAKDNREHDTVAGFIKQLLDQLHMPYETIFTKKILKLASVQHLFTSFKASAKQSNFQQWSQGLHPTPALGGMPRALAQTVIDESEPFYRGMYGAPMGIVSAHYIDMAVGIRSVLLYKNQKHVFAGAGIMPDSEPESEWQETGIKMNNFLEESITLSNPEASTR